MKLSEKEIAKLMKEAQKALDRYQDCESVTDVMASMYTERMPNKTMAQGQLMAEEINEQIKIFDSLYQSAVTNFDNAVRAYFYDATSDKSMRERCELLEKLNLTLTLINEADKQKGGDYSGIAEKVDQITVTEQEADSMLMVELMNKTIDELKKSKTLIRNMDKCAAELEELKSLGISEILTGFVGCETDYRALLTMTAYIKIKNEKIKGVPSDLTAAQVSALVYSGIEEMIIAEKTAGGGLTPEEAENFITILGTILMVFFTGAMLIYISIPTALTGFLAGLSGSLLVVFILASLFGLTEKLGSEKYNRLPCCRFNSIDKSAQGMRMISGQAESNESYDLQQTEMTEEETNTHIDQNTSADLTDENLEMV